MLIVETGASARPLFYLAVADWSTLRARRAQQIFGSSIMQSSPSLEIDMPFYRVWYRENKEPFEFSTPGICREEEIVRRVVEHEKLGTDDGGQTSSMEEMIARGNLAPISYTEDESELQKIA